MIGLVSGAVALPIVIVILGVTARFLHLLGDPDGAVWLQRMTEIGASLWAVDLVLLVIGGALERLFPGSEE